ncbi:uncharacterized protein LOC123957394 [Micropterus dolomieu]|uniref:uncharacterized protein LOC123957394 n=1 Tax=Micropterus dolomieu TaxID=147949 RepID=UPI001E8D5ECB|nr:uncharacterized protein LOC123957394 [Micropterus dolomieu]
MSGQRVCVADFEEEARKVLPKAVYDYYRSGADEQITLADNVAAFNSLPEDSSEDACRRDNNWYSDDSNDEYVSDKDYDHKYKDEESDQDREGGDEEEDREAEEQTFASKNEKVILEITNLDETNLCAYVGLLILVVVYRSWGEAAASLWDAESGRAIFWATMLLKVLMRTRRCCDSTTARPERPETCRRQSGCGQRPVGQVGRAASLPVQPRARDNSGRVACSLQRSLSLQYMYMPSKPAKYGIKSWVACDDKSSYAWKMQVYTGRPLPAAAGGPAPTSEMNLGMWSCST